jgi:hypothetical protein
LLKIDVVVALKVMNLVSEHVTVDGLLSVSVTPNRSKNEEMTVSMERITKETLATVILSLNLFLKFLLNALGFHIEYVVREQNLPYFSRVVIADPVLQVKYINKRGHLSLLDPVCVIE